MCSCASQLLPSWQHVSQWSSAILFEERVSAVLQHCFAAMTAARPYVPSMVCSSHVLLRLGGLAPMRKVLPLLLSPRTVCWSRGRAVALVGRRQLLFSCRVLTSLASASNTTRILRPTHPCERHHTPTDTPAATSVRLGAAVTLNVAWLRCMAFDGLCWGCSQQWVSGRQGGEGTGPGLAACALYTHTC